MTIMKLIIIFTALILSLGCLPRPQPVLVQTVYVPARDMPVPNMDTVVAAANSGNPMAQNHLGALYYRGYGVPKSHKEAKRWWEQSASSGFTEAQYNLGMLYFNGSGVKTDFVEGCRWLGIAAQQGHPDAMAEYRARCSR